MTQVFETTDPEIASEIFASQYTAARMRVSGIEPLFRVVQTKVGAARLDRTTFRMALESSNDPFEAFHVVRIRTGTVSYTSDGAEVTYGPGDTCLPVAPGPAWSARLQDVDSEVVVVDQASLNELAEGEPQTDTPVRLLSNRPVSPAAAARLWQTADAIRAMLGDEPQTVSSPLIVGPAARLLAALVLTTFPTSAVAEPATRDRHDARPSTLRRAIAFIDASADQDISIADIARAIYVTPRAVQLAFRRHLDTTPTAYLRQVRLQHAHQELQDASPGDGVTIARVAFEWGFPSPSRFAAHYRNAYGQPPSETLNS